MSLKIVLTGDNHLNYYNQKLGSRLAKRREYIGRNWRRTIDYAIEHEADLYLHTGDLFDQISPRNPPRASVVEGFRELIDAGVQPFIIAGNHEAPGSTSDGLSPHAVLHEAALATVFEDTLKPEQKIIEVNGIRVSITGMSYNQRLGPGKDPLQGITLPAGADYNIAMLHYSLDKVTSTIWEEPRLELSSLEENPAIQLYAMGHIHAHIHTMVGDSLVLYPGGTEHFDFGEAENSTGFCEIVFSDGKTRFEYIPLDSQPMHQLKQHTSSLPQGNPSDELLKRVEKASDPNGLLQLILEGEVPFDEYARIDFTSLFDRGNSANFYFEYVDRIKPRVEGLELEKASGLHPRGELTSVGMKAVENAADEEKQVWERALELALASYDKCQEGV
jgi:DNA repair exonuclease SbcCD nuclease subunit